MDDLGVPLFLETPIDIHTLNMTSSHTVNILRSICPCIYFYYDSYSFVVQIINKNWIQYEPMFVHRHGAVSSMWMFPKIGGKHQNGWFINGKPY